MTLTELLTDEELRLREFPVAREKIFLARGLLKNPAKKALPPPMEA